MVVVFSSASLLSVATVVEYIDCYQMQEVKKFVEDSKLISKNMGNIYSRCQYILHRTCSINKDVT